MLCPECRSRACYHRTRPCTARCQRNMALEATRLVAGPARHSPPADCSTCIEIRVFFFPLLRIPPTREHGLRTSSHLNSQLNRVLGAVLEVEQDFRLPAGDFATGDLERELLQPGRVGNREKSGDRKRCSLRALSGEEEREEDKFTLLRYNMKDPPSLSQIQALLPLEAKRQRC